MPRLADTDHFLSQFPDLDTMGSSKGDDTSVAVSPERCPHATTAEYSNFKTAKRSGRTFVPDDLTTTSDDEISREAALTALTAEEERKLLQKVDWRLIPLLCMLYLVKKLDESNVRDLLLVKYFPRLSTDIDC